MLSCHLTDRTHPEQADHRKSDRDDGRPGPVKERLQGELRRGRPMGRNQQQMRHTRIFVQFVVFWAALQSSEYQR